jgi:hypothetical protein
VPATGDVTLNETAVYELLNALDGPVGRMLNELNTQAASVARARVRVRRTPSRSRRSTAFPPGYTLASIRGKIGYDSLGLIYGGVTAAEDPTVYLEDPAEQMESRYPFLTTGLDSLVL